MSVSVAIIEFIIIYATPIHVEDVIMHQFLKEF